MCSARSRYGAATETERWTEMQTSRNAAGSSEGAEIVVVIGRMRTKQKRLGKGKETGRFPLILPMLKLADKICLCKF